MNERPYCIRLYVVTFFIMVCWLLLVVRLVFIQLVESEEYRERAKSQHERKVALEAKRGEIFDRNLEAMAVNLPTRSFAADPSEIRRPAEVALRLSAITGKAETSLLRKLAGQKSFVWLVRRPDDNVAEKIASLNLPGIKDFAEAGRRYPLGYTAAQLVGYTDVDNSGIEGIELQFDPFLRGTPGWAISDIDAKGRRIPKVGGPRKDPEDGYDMVLTIDAKYQAIAEEELALAVNQFNARAGVAIVMNPTTGEILAMASVPLYDPNNPGRYNADARRNRAIADAFEPGSVFKVIAASAAIEEGLKKPEDLVFCGNGVIVVEGEEIRDWQKYGWLTFKEVIAYSSNVGTIKVAQQVGKLRFYKYIRAFGFGSKTGVDLPGEVKGIVRHPSRWSGRSLATVAIGQEISVTPLQLAIAYSAIANGGYLMKPQIVKAIVTKNGRIVKRYQPEVVRRVISRKTAETVTDLLVSVVDGGTGSNAKIDGISVAGKTGTAQKADHGKGYLPGRFVSTFVGFLPAEAPELLCLVLVNEPKGTYWGGKVAAPVFKRIMLRILNLTGLQVSGKLLSRSGGGSAGPSLSVDGDVKEWNGRKDRVNGQSEHVPSVIGLTLREAVERLSAAGLVVNIEGSGVVSKQSPLPGSVLKKGEVCLIKASWQ